MYYYISRYLGHNFDENVTVSRAMSDLYFTLKLTPQRIQYIHLGMDLALPFAKENYGDFKMTTPQLIIVGRIEKIKGHQYLFDAMPDIMEVFPDVKLLILGNGAEKEQLVNQAAALGIENNISFLGYQQNPYDHIVQSDIIVLPSLFEPFGLVYIEAFALKTPVVAFDVPASNELITNNETGILVPVYDSRVMAEKIIYLLQNPLERKRLAENGFNKYTDYYLTSRMISETTSWYSTILKNMK